MDGSLLEPREEFPQLPPSGWEAAEARQHGFFRKVNERIAALGLTFRNEGFIEFICECDDASCTERIELSPFEYEQIRAHARRFAIAPDHENPSVEIVVFEGARFAIVETLVGQAWMIAEDTDPRASSTSADVEPAQRSSSFAS